MELTQWRADLHTHTTCSDGSLTPQELMKAAKASGLQGLSITDHDTLDAYENLQVPQGMLLCPGIELTTHWQGKPVHILAYGFSPDYAPLRALCAHKMEARRVRYFEMRRRLQSQGLPLPMDPPALPQSVGRPHLAQEMVELGLIRSVAEGFSRYLGDSHPAFVAGARVDTRETIEWLHAHHMWAILAHPMLVHRSCRREVLELPWDGVEAFYAAMGYHSREWSALASAKGWLATGGSDFHGTAKPDLQLGVSWTPQETCLQLCSRRP